MNWKLLWQTKRGLTPKEAASKRRVYTFLLCLLFSALFWLFIQLAKESQVDFTIPVSFESLPEGKVLISQSDSLFHFSMSASGARILHRRFFSGIDQIKMGADEIGATFTNSATIYFVTTDKLASWLNERMDAKAEVYAVSQDTLILELVPSARKRLPVKLDATITYAPRFSQYGKIALYPDSVTVDGPVTVLDTLQAVFTRYQTIGKLRKSTRISLPLLPPKAPSLFISVDEVELYVPVDEFTESSIDLPVVVECPDGYDASAVRLFPNQVTVSFLVSLKDYQAVTPHFFLVTVGCPHVLEDRNDRLQVKLEQYPSFVEVLYLAPKEVEYIILE